MRIHVLCSRAAGLAFLFAVSASVASPAAPAPTPRPRPTAANTALPRLTDLRSVRRLTLDQAQDGYPVQLRGVVTHFNTRDFMDLFINDGEIGQYVSFQFTRRVKQVFRPGDLVEVVGFTVRGDYGPDVTPTSVRIVGTAPLPKPKRLPYTDLATARHDSEYIEVSGVVQGAWLKKSEQTVLALDVIVPGGKVTVQAWDYAPEDVERLIDTRIRVIGVCGTDRTPRTGQFRGIYVFAGRTADIKIEAAAPDAFATPVQAVDTVLQYSAEGLGEHRSHVQGVVTAQQSARVLYIQDATSGMRIETMRDVSDLRIGDRIDLAGFAAPTATKPILRNAVYHKVGVEETPDPVELTKTNVLTETLDAGLVQARGKLLGVVTSSAENALVLQLDDTVFNAFAPAGPTANRLRDFGPGDVVSLTGVYVFRAEPPESFRVMLRTPGDIQLVKRAPWWTVRHTAVLLFVLLLSAGAAYAWVRTVKQKSVLLAEAEAAFRQLFDDAPVGYHELDRDGRLLRVNRTELAMLGYDAAGMLKRHAWDFVAGDDAARAIRQVLAGEAASQSGERTYRRSDGTLLPVIAEDRPIVDPDGRITGLRSTIQDISERKAAEEELRKAHGELETILSEVRDAAFSLASAANEILAASNEIAKGAEYGRDQVNSTSAAVEEMAASMQQVSKHAEQSDASARKVLEHVGENEMAVGETVDGMSRIDGAVAATAQKMHQLDTRSERIFEVIHLIEEISDQSKLLALNAAIEAAHAGEAGRGFGVVADEIRRLAEHSTAATKEATTIVKGITDETRAVLEAMENATHEVKVGRGLSTQAQSGLKSISSLARDSVQASGQISAASQEQAKATQTVSLAMQNLANITHQSSVAASETARAVQDLAALAEQLNKSISRFRQVDARPRSVAPAADRAAAEPRLARTPSS